VRPYFFTRLENRRTSLLYSLSVPQWLVPWQTTLRLPL
jgi:hypothetical protein